MQENTTTKNKITQFLNRKNPTEKIILFFFIIVTIAIILFLFYRFLNSFIEIRNKFMQVPTGNIDVFEIKCNDNCFCSQVNPITGKLDSDNSLNNIFISEGILKFDNSISNYNVLLENDIDKITLKAIKNSNKSTIYYIYNKKIYSGFSDIPIFVGTNVITIVVIAENGNLNSYQIIINRLNKNGELIDIKQKDANNNLSNIIISNGKLLFEKSKTNYTVFIDDGIDKITLTATKESEKSTVFYLYNGKKYDEFNDIEISSTTNIVTILVIAENGSSMNYVVTIRKPSDFTSVDDLQWYSTNNLNIFSNPIYNNETILAPGSSNSYEFIIKNKSNNSVKYKLEFTEKSDYMINMKYRLKRNGKYLIGDENTWVSYSELNTPEIEVGYNKADDYILDWKWFDGANDNLIGKLQDDYTLSITLSAIIQE